MLFAKLDLGVLVVDPNGYTLTVGPSPADFAAPQERLEAALAGMLSYGELPSGHRKSHWGRVVEALAERGVLTDPATMTVANTQSAEDVALELVATKMALQQLIWLVSGGTTVLHSVAILPPVRPISNPSR